LQDFGYYDSGLGRYNISASNQTLLAGTQLAMACVAAAISGPIGTYFGRRFGLFLCVITSIIGPAVQASSTLWSTVVVGRCISGLGIAFSQNFALAYWAEATPASLRGSVVVMYQGITNVSQFVAQCINEGTHNMDTRWAYRIPLLIKLLAPSILLGFYSGFQILRVSRASCDRYLIT
jgi:SP family sugar:H+ symporter-like MFS transporter